MILGFSQQSFEKEKLKHKISLKSIHLFVHRIKYLQVVTTAMGVMADPSG
jgi:hypothetical protein